MSGTVADNINRQSGVIAEPAGGPEVRSDDPAASVGVVWFNTTSDVLKVYRSGGVWSTGGTLGTARRHILGNNGTQSAAFVATGAAPNVNTSEVYNGSSWSSANASSQAKNSAAHSGTKTAGLLWGGSGPSPSVDTTEEFNGSSFTTSGVGTLAQAVYSQGGTGLQTATLSVGGQDNGSRYASAEEYNGTSWADGGDLAVVQRGNTTTGTLTAALNVGGYSSDYLNTAAEYDGTSWTSVTAISESKDHPIGFGVQTATIIAGGNTGTIIATVEQWSGSAWSTETSLPEEKAFGCGSGNATAGLAIGGQNQSGTVKNTTNEWDIGAIAKTITDS